jgi:hypothetical protein
MLSRIFLLTGLLVVILCVGCATAVEQPSPTLDPTNTAEPPQLPPPTTTEQSMPEATSTAMPINNLEDLAGVWYRYSAGFDLYLRIDEEGKATSTNMTGFATLEFIDGQLYWKSAVDYHDCPADIVRIYEVKGVPGEYIRIKRVEEPCDTYLPGKWVENTKR